VGEPVSRQPVARLRAIDRALAPVMGALALAFLVLLAAARPRMQMQALPLEVSIVGGVMLALIWLAFLAEGLARLTWLERRLDHSQRGWKRALAVAGVALVPPMRVVLTPATAPGCVWVLRLGWVRRGKESLRRLERLFSVPMMFIALMILPVLAIELFWQEQVKAYPALAVTLGLATRLIWLAFAVELVVHLAAARRRMDYAMQHWLDVSIVVIPLISFLRVLRLGRVLRIARMGRLARAQRIQRLRALAMRGYRALLLLKVLERFSVFLARKRLNSLKSGIRRKQEQIEELREEIEELEAFVAEGSEDETSADETGERAQSAGEAAS
jgi:voltage-gated potassium channel